MRLPDLFKREPRSPVAGPDPQERAEKLLVDAFRLLGQLCGKMADLIETQRLSRQGYEDQGRFLERLEGKAPPPSAEPPATPK